MMRITQGYLDQLEREAQRLEQQAATTREPTEARRLASEAQARRQRIARLRGERTDGVRFG